MSIWCSWPHIGTDPNDGKWRDHDGKPLPPEGAVRGNDAAEDGLREAPWPIVGECHYPAPSLVAQGHQCPQCDGSHDHEWVTWHDAPHPAPDLTGSSLVGKSSGPGLPVRCRICGGRKCDVPNCLLRRHHRGDHEHY